MAARAGGIVRAWQHALRQAWRRVNPLCRCLLTMPLRAFALTAALLAAHGLVEWISAPSHLHDTARLAQSRDLSGQVMAGR